MKENTILDYLENSSDLDQKLIDQANENNYNFYDSTIVDDIQKTLSSSIDDRKSGRIELENYLRNNSKLDATMKVKIAEAIAHDEVMEKMVGNFVDQLYQPTEMQYDMSTSAQQNRYYVMYYEAYNEILHNIIYYLTIMIILVVLQIYVTFPLSNYFYNFFQVIVSTFMIFKIILLYNDHSLRNKKEYEKYDFFGINIDFSGKKEDVSKNDAPLDKEKSVSDSKSEICRNDSCCPDTMYYNSLKNKCDFK